MEVETSAIESEVSVSTYTTSGCTTSVVLGLSKQISEEVGCMSPGSLVPLQAGGNLIFSSNAVLPYMHETAKADLLKVSATKTVQVNSGFRTVAQQYLLYRWYQLGRCGISAAATPGRSNHQSGRALDLANYSSLVTSMANRGWSHNVPGDPVHFEHLSSPDIRGKDVKAFQRLWNRNNPGDQISEDGAYGPQTEARLKAAPATGFPVGASCGSAAADVNDEPFNVIKIDGPDKLAPGARATYAVTIVNLSSADWAGDTKLTVADGIDSELYDSQAWTSPTEIKTLGSVVASGAQTVIEIPVLAPLDVSEPTAFNLDIALGDGTAPAAKIMLALSVTPNGDEDTSGDSSDEHDDGEDAPEFGEMTGGCNSGGSVGWLALVLPALVLRRRSRR